MKKQDRYLIGFPGGSVVWGADSEIGVSGLFAFDSFKKAKKALADSSLDPDLVIFKLVEVKEAK